MANRSIKRGSCAILAVALSLGPVVCTQTASAGDLNSEVNTMFNNLGTIGNYTAPGAFRGQTFNTYTGGSLFMRAPNCYVRRNPRLASASDPTFFQGAG